MFGRALYELIGSSKIVFNGAIDMAGTDRGNMRCFETMGCGALLVSDAGSYPAGMQEGETIETYGTPEQAIEVISRNLQDWPRSAEIAAHGRARIRDIYSKDVQWKQFGDLVGRV
ncbi:spore maturation protein CgeB [Bradyrhizobium sp. LB7.2]